MKRTLALLALLWFGGQLFADEPLKLGYKQTQSAELNIYVYKPQTNNATPAIVFFFGGGWVDGKTSQFEHQAKHFAARGMTAILVEYRTSKSFGTPPKTAVSDAKSAMRFIRANAGEFNIDPNRIVASGGSAGGHLAAATAYVTAFDDSADDLGVSPCPNALVLFNPVVDNSQNGYGYDRVKSYWSEFSPMHNITKGNVLPTLFMVGDSDDLIPVATAEHYKTITEKAGGRCDLVIYKGAKHGFFNYHNRTADDFYGQTLKEADDFLVSLKYLDPQTILKQNQ